MATVAGVLALFAILAIVSFVFLPTFLESLQPPQDGNPAIGRKLPALKLTPLVGNFNPVSLADVDGNVVLLNFWGTWCPPCRREFPHIVAIEQAYGRRAGFQLLAVSCGSGREDLARLRSETMSFLDQQGVTLPIYADPGAVTRGAAQQIGAFRGYPTTILLDGTGTVRGVWVGYRTGVEWEMRSLIDQLLDEQ
jgi:thiol-disulfide isomerase/thioredoxin